jgi:RNA polymerase sigma factor (sigma-70 family)
MSNPCHLEVNPPDPGILPPPDPPAGPVSRFEIDPLLCESVKTLLDRRARRWHDEPGLADAWARFHRDVAPLLRAAARRGRRSALDPDDATQEAGLVFLASPHPARPRGGAGESRARSSLGLANRLSNLGRRAAWRLGESLADEYAAALMGREEDPAVAYERGRVRMLVREAIEETRRHVPGPSHRVLVLRWIEGLDHAEIAEALGMTASQVHDRHRRAIPVLRSLLVRRFGMRPAGVPATNLDADPRGPVIEEVTP